MKQSSITNAPITNAPTKKAPKKKAIIDFVKLANHFFFFIGFLVIASIATFEFYKHYSRANQNYDRSLQIVDAGQAKLIPIEYKKSFVKKYEDIFVFKIRSNRLVSTKSKGTELVEINNFYGGYDVNDFESVNFLFTGPGSKPRLLLPEHSLILGYRLARLQSDTNSYQTQYKTTKHLFEVVRKDTNIDNVLNKDDQVDLLAANIDGTDMITVAHDVKAYEAIDVNQLLITRNIETGTEVSVYDLMTGKNRILDVETPEL